LASGSACRSVSFCTVSLIAWSVDVGHGKCGRSIRSDISPCRALHTSTASRKGSSRVAVAPACWHRSILSARPCSARRPGAFGDSSERQVLTVTGLGDQCGSRVDEVGTQSCAFTASVAWASLHRLRVDRVHGELLSDVGGGIRPSYCNARWATVVVLWP